MQSGSKTRTLTFAKPNNLPQMCSEDLICMFTQHTASYSTLAGHIKIILIMSEIHSQLLFHDLLSKEWMTHTDSHCNPRGVNK